MTTPERAPMTASQPITCPTCQGVIVSAQPSSYTSARGRLIVTNGYCQGGCPDPAPERTPIPGRRTNY